MSVKEQVVVRILQGLLGRGLRPRRSNAHGQLDVDDTALLTVPTSAGAVRVRVYRPAHSRAAPRLPVYVNFHGGGFIARHPEQDEHLCRTLAAAVPCVVLNVDYDVAPQRPYPTAPRQALGVTQWALRAGTEHGWDGGRFAVGGQSAGGNLAAGLCLALRDAGGPLPRLQILNIPPLDLATDPDLKRARIANPVISPAMAKLLNNAYLPDVAQRRQALASPLLAPSLAGLPPALVITAEHDLLADEGVAYAHRLHQAGVPVAQHMLPGVDHDYARRGPPAVLATALQLMTNALADALRDGATPAA